MKVRKKPVEVEAHFFCLTPRSAETGFWRGYKIHCTEPKEEGHVCGGHYIVIPTLEGDHRLDEGNYLMIGVEGEHYPCKREIFEKTYDIVDPDFDSGVEKMESRLAHNQEITGSSPVPATSKAEAFKAMDDFVPRVQPAVTAMNAVLDYSKPITVEQFNDYLMGLFSPPPVGKFRKIRVRTPFGIVEFDPKIVINKSPERGPSELAIELAEPEGSETKPEFFRKIMD